MNSTIWQQRRDILISIICIGIILWAAWTVLGQFVDVIVILLLSMAVAFLVTPLVNLLVKRKVPHVPATLLVYIVVLAVLSALGSLLIFSLVQQVVALSATVTNFFTHLPSLTVQFQEYLIKQHIPQDKITSAVDQISNQATTYAQIAAGSALNILLVLSGALINILLILVLSVYLTLDGKRIRDSLVNLAPQSWLKHVLLFEETLNKVVGNYIRGQLTLAVIIGVLAGLVCIITGLGQYALIIGALGFLFETIPMVGPALASLPAILLSLLLPAPFPRTFYVIILFVVIQAIESNVLGPRIVGRAVGLHPVASILALLAGAKLFGAFGALLATPIVAAAWVMIASIYRSTRGESAEHMLAQRRDPWTVPYSNRVRERFALRRRHVPPRELAYSKAESSRALERDGDVHVEPEQGEERVTSAEKPGS
ncbi:MAG: AI-2E family transporter [Ktedonobacteraceae bacterium]|nr:AI-2E family transporter [Ktedonobacteraceae bacterium]